MVTEFEVPLAYTVLNYGGPETFYVLLPEHTLPMTPCGDAGTYVSRFGDVVCMRCHEVIMWSPQLVRDGLYDDDTDEWKRQQELHHQRTRPGVDAWGRSLMQPGDGHSAWGCNNYRCTLHPASLYPQFGATEADADLTAV